MPGTHPTVREARAAFFSANGFGDGGYDDAYAEADFGVLHYRVPNPPKRAAALRLHDLHHVLTGYATDWRGEAQISAWELGSGVGDKPWAWMIMLWGMGTGLLLAPLDTVRAFFRGRRSNNLYGRVFDERLLDGSVADLRRELAVLPPSVSPWAGRTLLARAGDTLSLAGWSVASLAYGVVGVLPSLGLVAWAWVQSVARVLHWMRCPLGCPASGARGF